MCLCKLSAELFEGTTFTESQVQRAAFSRVVCQNEVVYTESCLCTLLENKTFLDYWFASVGVSNLTLCTFKDFFFVCTHTSTSVCFSAARLYQRHHTGPAELWTPPGTQGLTEVQSGRLPLPGLLTVCRRLSWTTVPTCWRRSTLKKKKIKKNCAIVKFDLMEDVLLLIQSFYKMCLLILS